MKRIKGFTLVELIIVMALLTTVLTAILQLMQPVNDAYRDATIYEQQRTAESGIISYITETTRYADHISIVDQNITTSNGKSISTLSNAVDYFKDKNSIKDSDDDTIQIIVIDRKTKFKYGTKECTGRIIRMKGWDSDKGTWSGPIDCNQSLLSGTNWNSKARYIAMGYAYYGNESYNIYLPNDCITDINSDSIKDRMDSKNQLTTGFDIVVSTKTPNKGISTKTNGSVTNMNYTINASIIDYQTYFNTDNDEDVGKGVAGDPSGTSLSEIDTYIIFTIPKS